MDFISPELLVLVPLLYFVGIALKNTKSIADNFIPLILGCVGMAIALLWVLGTSESLGAQSALLAAFTAIVQGWLCAGMSVYINQIVKQKDK